MTGWGGGDGGVEGGLGAKNIFYVEIHLNKQELVKNSGHSSPERKLIHWYIMIRCSSTIFHTKNNEYGECMVSIYVLKTLPVVEKIPRLN